MASAGHAAPFSVKISNDVRMGSLPLGAAMRDANMAGPPDFMVTSGSDLSKVQLDTRQWKQQQRLIPQQTDQLCSLPLGHISYAA